MPLYTYRREDGTTFDIKQKFLDDELTVCPTTGQKVWRVVQPASIIFRGSGFYVTDNKSAKKNVTSQAKTESSSNGSSETTSESKSDSKPKVSESAAD